MAPHIPPSLLLVVKTNDRLRHWDEEDETVCPYPPARKCCHDFAGKKVDGGFVPTGNASDIFEMSTLSVLDRPWTRLRNTEK